MGCVVLPGQMRVQTGLRNGFEALLSIICKVGGAGMCINFPGLAYVQDERYAAGAWMRRSGLPQFCTAFLTQCGSQGGMASVRNQSTVITHSAEGVRYLYSGP